MDSIKFYAVFSCRCIWPNCSCTMNLTILQLRILQVDTLRHLRPWHVVRVNMYTSVHTCSCDMEIVKASFAVQIWEPVVIASRFSQMSFFSMFVLLLAHGRFEGAASTRLSVHHQGSFLRRALASTCPAASWWIWSLDQLWLQGTDCWKKPITWDTWMY